MCTSLHYYRIAEYWCVYIAKSIHAVQYQAETESNYIPSWQKVPYMMEASFNLRINVLPVIII